MHVALDGMRGEGMTSTAWQSIAQDFIQEFEWRQNSGHAIEDVGSIDFAERTLPRIVPDKIVEWMKIHPANQTTYDGIVT